MNSKGIVLINAMILMLIMVFVAGVMLQLSLGRTTMVAHHRSSAEAKRLAESMNRIMGACITDMYAAGTLTTAACPGGVWNSTWWVARWFGNTPRAGCYTSSGADIWDTTGFQYTFTAVWCGPADVVAPGTLSITCTNC